MGIKQLYNDNLRKLPNEYGDVSVMCSITGVSERLHKVLGQVGSKLWFPWQQKAPIDLQWGK